MKYILDPQLQMEKAARLRYLYEIFDVYFIEKSPGVEGLLSEAIVFESFPSTFENDICIICGHNLFVAATLNVFNSEIPEKNIFIISCANRCRELYRVKGKNIFLSPQDDEYAYTHLGKFFGFDFNITDAELNLYNNHWATAEEKLYSAFDRL